MSSGCLCFLAAEPVLCELKSPSPCFEIRNRVSCSRLHAPIFYTQDPLGLGHVVLDHVDHIGGFSCPRFSLRHVRIRRWRDRVSGVNCSRMEYMSIRLTARTSDIECTPVLPFERPYAERRGRSSVTLMESGLKEYTYLRIR
jgi:hypothetical protein